MSYSRSLISQERVSPEAPPRKNGPDSFKTLPLRSEIVFHSSSVRVSVGLTGVRVREGKPSHHEDDQESGAGGSATFSGLRVGLDDVAAIKGMKRSLAFNI